MDNLIESYSFYLIQRINTKKDKALYSEILGVFLYAAYPKPNKEIFSITSKISNSDNQIRVVGHYFIDYLDNQGWESTEKSIDNILPFLILFEAYCDQLPGAEPRSINEIPFFIILNF